MRSPSAAIRDNEVLVSSAGILSLRLCLIGVLLQASCKPRETVCCGVNSEAHGVAAERKEIDELAAKSQAGMTVGDN